MATSMAAASTSLEAPAFASNDHGRSAHLILHSLENSVGEGSCHVAFDPVRQNCKVIIDVFKHLVDGAAEIQLGMEMGLHFQRPFQLLLRLTIRRRRCDNNF